MRQCPLPHCGWQAIAPSEEAASRQLEEHFLEVHTEEVDADIPEGMVQVRCGPDDEWRTMTPEEARAFHQALYRGDGTGDAG